jgi:hypothetical protein
LFRFEPKEKKSVSQDTLVRYPTVFLLRQSDNRYSGS